MIDRLKLIPTIFIFILFSSCEARIDLNNIADNVALQPSLIVPLGSASVSLGQILSTISNPKIDTSDAVEISFISTDSTQFSFSGLNFQDSIMFGNLNTNAIASGTYQESWNFDFYFPSGLLKFTNPQISITLSTNIGTYLNFQIDSVKAFNSTNLAFPPTYAWFNNHTINQVNDGFDSKPKSPGLFVTKTLKTFDKDWGETNNLFSNENKYDKIQYKFSAWVNQTLVQNDSSPSFITSNQTIKVLIATKIPFQFDKGSYFNYTDTISNVLGQISTAIDTYSSNGIDTATLILNIKNGLPLQTKLTLNFLDSTGNIIPTDLVKNYSLSAGNVDKNGIVQSGSERKQVLTFSISKTQLMALKNAESIVYTIQFAGENMDANIHFTKSTSFDMQVGLFLKAELSGTFGNLIP